MTVLFLVITVLPAAGHARAAEPAVVQVADGVEQLGWAAAREGKSVSVGVTGTSGMGVRARYTLTDGRRGTVALPDGARPGTISTRTVTSGSNPVVHLRACAGFEGADQYCSAG